MMIELEKNLAFLIQKYKYITIPEFGTFYLYTKDLSVLENKQSFTFSSTKQIIDFKELEDEDLNNSFLLHHLSFSLEKPYDLIKKEVLEIVSIWKKEISTNKIKEFKNLGLLTLNDETKQLDFESNKTFLLGENVITFEKIKRFSFKLFFSNSLYYLTIFILLLTIFYVLFYYLTPYEIIIPKINLLENNILNYIKLQFS
ncbi:MAG: hypothetical protein ACEQSF_05865 [Solirubrobacteraceae bacterium]